MSREILLLVDALGREKNVDKEIVFGALELALSLGAELRQEQMSRVAAHLSVGKAVQFVVHGRIRSVANARYAAKRNTTCANTILPIMATGITEA